MYLKCGKILCLQFHLLAFISTMVGSQCDHSFSQEMHGGCFELHGVASRVHVHSQRLWGLHGPGSCPTRAAFASKWMTRAKFMCHAMATLFLFACSMATVVTHDPFASHLSGHVPWRHYPTNPLDWAPLAHRVKDAGDFPFGMARNTARLGASEGSKQFSGFKSLADVEAGVSAVTVLL